jgi:outer membrane lipoprotein-sorting protein
MPRLHATFARLLSPFAFAALAVFALSASAAHAQVVYNPANGHHYESVEVPGGLTWREAAAAAAKRTFGGVRGYLVCPTSAEETAFLMDNVALGDFWMGAYQDPGAPDYKEPAGGWRWVSGEPWRYTNWNSGLSQEPNNSEKGEDFGSFWSGARGKWNDAVDTSKHSYVVEYPTPPGAAGEGVPALESNKAAIGLLQQVWKKYHSYTSFSASVEAKVIIDVYKEEVESARAEFTWYRPNYFRLVGSGFSGRVTAVGDGTNLFMIDRTEPDTYAFRPMPSLTEAVGESLTVLSDAFAAPVTLGFLGDPAPNPATAPWLKAVRMGSVVESADDPILTVRADLRIRYDDEPGIRAEWKLSIRKKDLTIVGSELRFRHQAYPLIITQAFKNVEVNPTLPEDQFNYAPPRGAERVRRLRGWSDPVPAGPLTTP